MRKDVKIHFENDEIISQCDKGGCEGCKSSIFCRSKSYSFKLTNPNNITLKDGDEVTIEMPAGRTILSSFMSLFFPLLCFFIPLAISALVFKVSEIKQFLFALLGLAVGSIISTIYFKINKNRFIPYIVEKKDA